jgi:hypothetical protein
MTGKMKTSIRSIVVGLALVSGALVSCQTATPQGRSERHPEMVAKLTDRQRVEVTQGKISEGMSRDAVYLAWGRPDDVSRGREEGADYEEWRYLRTQTVNSVSIGMGFGSGWGYGHGPYCRGGYAHDIMVPMAPDYVTTTAAVVAFRNGRVSRWKAAF